MAAKREHEVEEAENITKKARLCESDSNDVRLKSFIEWCRTEGLIVSSKVRGKHGTFHACSLQNYNF